MTAINLNRTTEPAGVMAKPNVRIGHFKERLSEEKRKPHHHITNKFALDMTRNQTHRELDSHAQKEIGSHTTEHHAHDEFMHNTTENKGHQTSLLLIEITIDLALNVDMSQAPDVNGLIPGSPEGSNISGIPPIRVELTVSKHEDLCENV